MGSEESYLDSLLKSMEAGPAKEEAVIDEEKIELISQESVKVEHREQEDLESVAYDDVSMLTEAEMEQLIEKASRVDEEELALPNEADEEDEDAADLFELLEKSDTHELVDEKQIAFSEELDSLDKKESVDPERMERIGESDLEELLTSISADDKTREELKKEKADKEKQEAAEKKRQEKERKKHEKEKKQQEKEKKRQEKEAIKKLKNEKNKKAKETENHENEASDNSSFLGRLFGNKDKKKVEEPVEENIEAAEEVSGDIAHEEDVKLEDSFEQSIQELLASDEYAEVPISEKEQERIENADITSKGLTEEADDNDSESSDEIGLAVEEEGELSLEQLAMENPDSVSELSLEEKERLELLSIRDINDEEGEEPVEDITSLGEDIVDEGTDETESDDSENIEPSLDDSAETSEDIDSDVDDKKKKKKKEKKKKKSPEKSTEDGTEESDKKLSLFSKLKAFLNEEDEEEEPELPTGKVSDENQAILDELDEEGSEEGKKGKKGKKAKKGKKEKKEKEPKEKKPKKEKKLKKEKEPKEEEALKKLPKKKVRAAILFGVTLLAVLLLICLLFPSKLEMNKARQAYYDGKYEETYEALYGRKLNEKDQKILAKSGILLRMQRKIDAYNYYKNAGKELEAINALIQGVSKYYEVEKQAEELGIPNKVKKKYNTILDYLHKDYNVPEYEAILVSEIEDDTAYSIAINNILNGLTYNASSPEDVREDLGPLPGEIEEMEELIEEEDTEPEEEGNLLFQIFAR